MLLEEEILEFLAAIETHLMTLHCPLEQGESGSGREAY
jgi:hypothetical protein